ncbi:hypothetical protein P26059A_0083 [Curvibacter phage P26059A]|nr:hypothetical protein P26059A_0083 [Curvibacter phage P26059A]
MSNELMVLIDDYAEWSAQSYWEDDQGGFRDAEIARANKEEARKAVVDAVAELQAENERNEKSAKHFHDLFHSTADENTIMQAENERLKRELEISKMDVKEWHSQADTLAAPKVLVPLTQVQVVEGFCNTPHQVQYIAVFDAGVRFAEATHGIHAKGGQQ